MNPTKTDTAPRRKVLVVDDAAENIRIVGEILRPFYEVKVALNGEKALAIAGSGDPPDLVLLDVVMPGLDGYETCSRLKLDPRTRDLPVLFLSSLSEVADKVEAFARGGVDFITKPFQAEEVLARVRTHLELLDTRQQLAGSNQSLKSSLDKLQELELMRDNLVHMMAHDMRSPIMAIHGNLELLRMELGEALPSEQEDLFQTSFNSCRKLVEMVSAMLDVSKLESGKMAVSRARTDVTELTRQAVRSLAALAGEREIRVEMGKSEVLATLDAELTHRVIANLLGNALKFTPPSGSVTVAVRHDGDSIEVAVRDTGPGVPPEHHQRIFEKFGQVQSGPQRVKYSTGLGLTFCKLAVEAMGGRIGLSSEVGKGSTFWFRLPAGQAEPAVEDGSPRNPSQADPDESAVS